MILTRLTRSFRDHDWFTGFVELILLIIGIFFGFQLDRWNDGRLDQRQADEYRQQLVADLELERTDVNRLVAYHEQVRDFAMTALSAWSDEARTDTEAMIVAFYQASNVLPFTSARGAFDALSNNGLIDLVGGPGLTSRLAAYYGQGTNTVFAEEKAYRMQLRGAMPIAVQQQITTECVSLSIAETIVEVLEAACDLNLGAAEAEQILADLVAYPRMRDYLRQAISRDSVIISLLKAKRDFVDTLLAELLTRAQPAREG